MIEPTESESREECDLFIRAMRAIAEEAAQDPERVRTAPHSTRVSRLDEVRAARRPVLRWKPEASAEAAEGPAPGRENPQRKRTDPTRAVNERS